MGCSWTLHIATGIGYRVLGVDYEDGGFGIDTITQGFLIGLELRF